MSRFGASRLFLGSSSFFHMLSCQKAPHPLPLELIRKILELCVHHTIDIEPSIAAELQLVSHTAREWLAPLIYGVFVIRPPYKEPEEPRLSSFIPSDRNSFSSSLRGFHSFLQMPSDGLSPRRYVRTLAIQADPNMTTSSYGLEISKGIDLLPIWSLDTVLVPSLAIWTTISRVARGALQPRVVSCAEELFPPFPNFFVSSFISARSPCNGLKGVSELRVRLDRNKVPGDRQALRLHEMAMERIQSLDLLLARRHDRETTYAEYTRVAAPPQPARYAVSGRPNSLVLQASILGEQDVVQLKEKVRHLLTQDVSGDEMKVIVEVLQTDEPSPYLFGPALLRELRPALNQQASDRLAVRTGRNHGSSMPCTVAEEVYLRRIALTIDYA